MRPEKSAEDGITARYSQRTSGEIPRNLRGRVVRRSFRPKTFGPVEFGRHVTAELSTATGAPRRAVRIIGSVSTEKVAGPCNRRYRPTENTSDSVLMQLEFSSAAGLYCHVDVGSSSLIVLAATTYSEHGRSLLGAECFPVSSGNCYHNPGLIKL